MPEAIQQTVRVDPAESVCTAVITAVANAKDVDPTELDQRLNDVIDPDALDRIFRDNGTGRGRSNGHVSFLLDGYEVVVTASGQVTVKNSEDDQSISVGGPSPDGNRVNRTADFDG